MSTTVVPFGKHKGKPIEALAEDRQYLDWLMAQDWFRQRHSNLYQIVINNFGEPSETPEHNALQALFLDQTFQRGLLNAISWEPRKAFNAKMTEWLKDQISFTKSRLSQPQMWLDRAKQKLSDYQENLGKPPRYDFLKSITDDDVAEAAREVAEHEAKIAEEQSVLDALCKYADGGSFDTEIQTTVKFEERGWDVFLEASLVDNRYKIEQSNDIFIEIKPALGDDYPATLRQIKATNLDNTRYHPRRVLVFDHFTAIGATLDQVKAIFQASHIKVVSIADITACSTQPYEEP